MTQPVEVVVDKVRQDATRWSTASDEMEAASRSAGGLALGADKLGYVAQERGLIAAYDALKETLTHLLGGAGTEFESLATTLRQIAAEYERLDATGVQTFLREGTR
jgi:hypothetical protein